MRKRLMSGLLGAVLLAVAAAPAVAQHPAGQEFAYLDWQDDWSAGSYTYCLMTGKAGDPFGEALDGPAFIKTTGSSQSVTENTAGTNPFAQVAIGDLLIVRKPATTGTYTYDRVAVTARADSANVTVAATVDWTGGYAFRFLKRSCGSAATNGWLSTGTFNTMEFTVEWISKAGTSMDWSLECAIGPSQPVIVNQGSLTVAGAQPIIVTAGVYDRCRFGLKITGDSGTNSVNAYAALKW